MLSERGFLGRLPWEAKEEVEVLNSVDVQVHKLDLVQS